VGELGNDGVEVILQCSLNLRVSNLEKLFILITFKFGLVG